MSYEVIRRGHRCSLVFDGPLQPVVYWYVGAAYSHVHWNAGDIDQYAEALLRDAIDATGVHDWLEGLFRSHEDEMDDRATLTGPSYGVWSFCPNHLVRDVTDTLGIVIAQALPAVRREWVMARLRAAQARHA